MDFDAPAATDCVRQPGHGRAQDDAFVLDLRKNGPATDIDMANLAREFDLPAAHGSTRHAAGLET
jgi:hypothetical protein